MRPPGGYRCEKITSNRGISRRHKKISWPTASPVSTDECRLSAVTPARSSSRLKHAGIAGFTTNSPSLVLRLTSGPAPRPIYSDRPPGMRRPRLFHHFWIRIRTGSSRIYAEYTRYRLRPQRFRLSNAPPERRAGVFGWYRSEMRVTIPPEGPVGQRQLFLWHHITPLYASPS